MYKPFVTIFIITLALSTALHASKDPVSWSLNPMGGFPGNTPVGNQSVVTYTFTNQIPLPQPVTIRVSEKLTGGVYSVHDECKNNPLAHHEHCDVTIGFHPTHAQTGSLQVTYGYHNNEVRLPTLASHATGHDPNAKLLGKIYGLPPVFYVGNTPSFRVEYTNQGDEELTNCTVTNPFKQSGTANVTINSAAGTPACGGTLSAHHSCFIDSQIATATTPGSLLVESAYVCDEGSARPQAAAVVKTPSQCILTGAVPLPLPSNTYRYAENVVKYEFKNPCQAGQNLTLGQVSITANTPTGQAKITMPSHYDECSNKTLSPGHSCFVTASVIPENVTNNLTVTASVLSGATQTRLHTSAAVTTNQTSSHEIQFVNQCDFAVWYGIANGNGGIFTPDPNLKSYPNGAPPSSYFLQQQTLGLAPNTLTLKTDEYKNGALWPRTGCTMDGGQFQCATGTCATLAGSATCVPRGSVNNQPVPPYTKFEFFIVKNAGGDGVYDVSLINGFNVPVTIKAFGPVTSNPFNCTGAGSLIQPDWFTGADVLGACPWLFNPDSSLSRLDVNDFLWVRPGNADNCHTDNPIPPDCGRAFTTVDAAPIVSRQGDFLGYSTIANYAGYSDALNWGAPNLFEKYGMDSPFPAGANYGTLNNVNATWLALFLCKPTSNNSANTCYNTTFSPLAIQNCCGCVNWQSEPMSSPVRTASSMMCVNDSNLLWTSTKPADATADDFNIKQGVIWLKAACPTAYSYQFDDKSSSFQCNNDNTKKLMTSYQITFCPGGVNSKPDGVAEGRNTPTV